jgi:Fic family protein
MVGWLEKNLADLLTNYRWFRDKQLVIPRAARLMLALLRIHPFANGNGRVARYLGNLLLVVNGIDPKIYDKP